MLQICRLCLNDTTKPVDEETPDDCTLYKTQIKSLMPEIDLTIPATFTLCNHCSLALNSAYIFKSECMRVEQGINNYRKQLDTHLIDLREIKTRRLSVDYNDFSSVGVVKIEDCDNNVEDMQSINVFESITLICDKCHGVFSDKNIFQQHTGGCGANNECQNEHRCEDGAFERNAGSFMCNICNQMFTKSSALKSHSKTHLKQSEYICDICTKAFKTKCQFEEHIFSHTNTKRYSCKICNKGYNRKYALQIHEEVHKDNKYDCSLCIKFFPSRLYLKRHQLNCHFGTYICETCGIKCGTKYGLKEHSRSHTGDRPYKCEVCGKGFAQSGTLSVHIKSKHVGDRPYVCGICGKAFAYKGGLRGHMVTHMNIPDKNFICCVGDCSKSFRTASNLRDHTRRHNLPKDFKCSVCEKGFKDATALRRHVRTHTGEKPYECSTCLKTFSEKYNLQTHFKSHRSKKSKVVPT